MKVEWRSATTKSGVRSVMTSGIPLMLEWPASNLGTQELVSINGGITLKWVLPSLYTAVTFDHTISAGSIYL